MRKDEIEKVLGEAVQALREGKVILYPTDTIWGLGCDATNPEAVRRIYEIKHSAEVVPEQMRHLLDEEKCKATEHRFGPDWWEDIAQYNCLLLNAQGRQVPPRL